MHNQFKPGDWSQLKQKAQAAADEFGSYDPAEAEIEFMSAIKPDVILALIAENERLRANVKMNLCDYPAIHHGDVELLISVIEGATQSELARLHKCTSQNICRKIRRVKERLGWKKGMGAQEVLERADQLRALAKQGAVVASDIIDERDQIRAEVEALRGSCKALGRENTLLTRRAKKAERAVLWFADIKPTFLRPKWLEALIDSLWGGKANG